MLGSRRTSPHGSPIRSIPRRSSRLSPRCQHPLSLDKSRFPAGTLAASARATALIHGTGRRWRNSLLFLRMPVSPPVVVSLGELIVAKDGVGQFPSMSMPLSEPITFQNVPFSLVKFRFAGRVASQFFRLFFPCCGGPPRPQPPV